MKIKTILATIGAFLSLLFFAIFRGYKKGRAAQIQEDNSEAIKDALEIKKDEKIRLNDGVDAARDRLRKYARD